MRSEKSVDDPPVNLKIWKLCGCLYRAQVLQGDKVTRKEVYNEYVRGMNAEDLEAKAAKLFDPEESNRKKRKGYVCYHPIYRKKNQDHKILSFRSR